MTDIILKDLKKVYTGRTIFENVNLEVSSHNMICIKGKSGKGKSTLLNIIAGLELANAGTYFFGDIDMRAKSLNILAKVRGEHIGYISQYSPMIPNLTAFENICVPLWLNRKGNNKDESFEKIKYLSELLEIKELLNTKVKKLSGGEVQRIGIIRALIYDPKLIVADEPTGSLDDETSEKILELFNVLKSEGIMIILATHSKLVSEFCDRTYLLGKNGLELA